MFVSFLLPSVFEGVVARHLLVFYKQLADFGVHEVAFVGEPDYFLAPSELEALGRPEWQATWREAYDYAPPATLDGVRRLTLPDRMLAARLSRVQSSWKLYGQLVTRRLPEVEAAFAAALDELSAHHTVEAAVTLANMPSLSHVARERGVPVIHAEFGPLRKPSYAMTGYWDLCGVSRRTDAARRFRRFQREMARRPLPLLDCADLLQAIRWAPMPEAFAPADAPFRVGLALQGEENAHVHGVSALDCLSVARRHCHQDDILIRYHSGGLARYSDTLGVADKSADATEFILKCERIVTVNSGVALEALLLGRRCVVLGDSPFSLAADRSFDAPARRDTAAERMALNFLVFGYLVPCALMFDPEYSRWRLGNPPEAEIFQHHQDWYRTHRIAARPIDAVSAGAVRSPIVVRSVESPAENTREEEPGEAPAAILVVYPFCLDQVGHGNIQRLLSLARYFAAAGFAVDLVYQGNPRIAQVSEQYADFRRVHRVEGGAPSSDEDACARRLAAFYAGHELPARHLQPSAPLTTVVRALIDAEPYRAVVATYAWTAPIFVDLARRVPLVCDVQDIMHEHADACRRATGQSTSFSLPAATEEFLWRQWDVLVAITPDDMARIRKDTLPHQRLLSARHAARSFAAGPRPGDDDVALYAASDNTSNVQALEWLLAHVWPIVRARRPAARLRIAGLICRSLSDSVRTMPGVDVAGFQPNLDEDVDRAGVIVAPYLYGSGLKIKVVEAACGGKAILTTRAGLIGTGLERRRAVEVEDDPAAFAGALVRLLGDSGRRRSMAATALEQARDLFSAEACYAPVVRAIRLLGASAPPAPGHGLSPAVLGRLTVVIDHIRPARVVLWGNGAHTRTLTAALASSGVTVGLIADGRATAVATSPEGIAVVPGSQLVPSPDDLVILSSETFERDMWHDLTAYRDAGGLVLGIWEPRHVSRALLDRLSTNARVHVGAPAVSVRVADAPPALVVWDAYATPDRWWRLQLIHDLAVAAHHRGIAAVVAGPAALAKATPAVADLPLTATLAPVLELEGRSLEAGDPDGGAGALSRLATLSAKTSRQAAAFLTAGRHDVLLLMSPSLSECFGLAQALGGHGQQGPAIVIHGLSPSTEEPHWLHLSESDRRAYWKLGVTALVEASGGRCALVTSDRPSAAALQAFLNRPVSAVGYPAARDAVDSRAVDGRGARVVCFGHVGAANVRPMLEEIVRLGADSPAGPVSVSWRSNQHDARPGAENQWAVGLASLLGIDLLDGASPSTVRASLAHADAVVIMSDVPGERWAEAVCAHAAAAGTPVLAPDNGLAARAIAAGAVSGSTFATGEPDALVTQLRPMLAGVATRSAQDGRRDARASLAWPTPDAVLARILDALATGPSIAADEPPLFATTHVPSITETTHAATY